jgi:hypothetical protein
MHGITHVAGGPDPVPGLLPAGTSGTYPEKILSLTGLVGYWRLGESSSPFADTSGYASGPADMIQHTLGTPLTTNVTGALNHDDDGAVQLNAGLWSSPVNDTGDWLATGTFAYLVPASVTLACYLKPHANSGVWRGHAFGNFRADSAAGFPGGHAIFVDYPTLDVLYIRAHAGSASTTWVAASGGALTPDVWVLIVATYDQATGTLAIYRDGVLADTHVGSPSVNGDNSLAIGRSINAPAAYAAPSDFQRPAWFQGAVDEAAVWSRALTGAEAADLADTGASGGTISAGEVLTADGSGGVTWSPPTLATFVNGA